MKSTAVSDGTESLISVITGPTAAGKSALAMQLARARNLAIVSADSRQVYRGFDIGTAKPSPAEQREVVHYGIDVVDPRERYSAHAWATDAAGWMRESHSRGIAPVVVGGTGFYVRALVRPLSDVPAIDEHRRTLLAAFLDTLDIGTLQRWCLRLDPARAHLGRTQLLRAVETALLAGEQISRRFAPSSQRAVRYLVIDPGVTLGDRIRERVNSMFRAGWADEVRELMASVPDDAPAWLASGYGVVREYVRGVIDLGTAVERVVIETRQYAKRQRTWCRHQLTEGEVTRVNPLDADAFDRVCAWWDSVLVNTT